MRFCVFAFKNGRMRSINADAAIAAVQHAIAFKLDGYEDITIADAQSGIKFDGLSALARDAAFTADVLKAALPG